jgi:Na+-driven multidrug efflux pump
LITNLSVALLTGIAGHLGQKVAMVGTNWGARQYRRAREIAWTGAATVAAACAAIGMIVAFPSLRMGLFADDAEIVAVGASYL